MIEQDIWRSAKCLVDLYGVDATIHATKRADDLLEQGDMDGAYHVVGLSVGPFFNNINYLIKYQNVN